MKDFLEVVSTFLTKPINIGIVIALNFTSLILLLIGIFLPEQILIKYNLNTFYTNHFSTILIVFLVSLFLFITQIVPVIFKKYQSKQELKKIKEKHQALLNDPNCWNILLKVYEGQGDPVMLPEKNQKVMLLRSNLMIIRTTDQILGSASDLINPYFPYVLQPWVENYIKENINE